MSRLKRPEVGSKMYCVREHLYWPNGDKTQLHREFCVCEAVVRDYFEGRPEYVYVRINGPKGLDLENYRLSEIGEKLFYTPREAAVLAEQETNRWDRFVLMLGNPPMRRPWADLLGVSNSDTGEE